MTPRRNHPGVLAALATAALALVACDRKEPASAGEFGVKAAPAAKPASMASLISDLQAQDAGVRLRAASALREMTYKAADARLTLITVVNDDADALVRAEAANTLGYLGPEAGEALAHAVRFDPSEPVRAAAALALGRIGPEYDRGLSAVTGALAVERRDTVRARMVAALEAFGAPAKETLRKAQLDESSLVRDRAALALERIDKSATAAAPPTPTRVGDLTRSLREGDSMTRVKAAQDLGRLGAAAVPALPALTEALKSSDLGVRVAAAGALRMLGPDAIPALLLAARDTDPSVRSTAAQGLGRLSSPSRDNRDTVRALEALLKDDEMGVRATAVVALEQVGPEALPALRKAADDSDWYVRDRARKAVDKVTADRAGAR